MDHTRSAEVELFHVDRGCKRDDRIWPKDYNCELLHGSLDFMRPFEYAESMRISSPSPKNLVLKNLVPEFLVLPGPDPPMTQRM